MLKFPDGAGGVSVAVTVERLAARWFPGGATLQPLASPGFSGSPLFLVQPTGHGPHVLKCFAVGTSRSRAEWIHRVLRHVGTTEARALIPAVCESIDGDTLVPSADDRLWEMLTWVEGNPVISPSRSQMTAAMHAVARLHLALADVPGEEPRFMASHGVEERILRARRLLGRPWRRLLNLAPQASALEQEVGSVRARAGDIFEAYDADVILQKVATLASFPLLCQSVLRDVWCDHVLFDRSTPDHVAGVVDFHAIGIDTPAVDVARLLGSWLRAGQSDNAAWWDSALDAYETVRSLGARERRLVPLLAATGIIFGLDNWFRWTLEEGRTFPDLGRVVSRMNRLVTCLPAALNALSRADLFAGLTLENSSP